MSQKSRLSFSITTVFLFVFMCACDEQAKPGTVQIDSEPPDKEVVELPEPLVEDGNDTRFTLTGLKAVEEKFFKINDDIVFTGLEKQLKTDEFLQEVMLRIRVHCVVNENKVLIREVTRNLSHAIPLIELLPVEALLPQEGETLPSCGFSFKAEHAGGAAHHFELPVLPVQNYKTGTFIQLLNVKEGKVDKLFPYVFMDQVSDYWIDAGNKEPVDNLHLICSDFSLNLPIRFQQFVPFSVFRFYQLFKEEEKMQNISSPHQLCRIFGYKKDTLVGVSPIFNLLYPPPRLHVKIDTDVLLDGKTEWEDAGDEFYRLIINDEKWIDVAMYTYVIENPYQHPVHILFHHSDEVTELSHGLYQLYHSLSNGQNFYERDPSALKLGKIQMLEGTVNIQPLESPVIINQYENEGFLATLHPQSQIQVPVVLSSEYSAFCDMDDRDKGAYWMGAIIRFPDLGIYQLNNPNIDSIPLEKNIIYKLDTKAGESFNILPDYVLESRSVSESRYLWFREGSCSVGKIGMIKAVSKDVMIEMRRSTNKARIRWVPTTPISQAQFNKGNRVVRQLVLRDIEANKGPSSTNK